MAEYSRVLAKTKTSKPVGDILQSTAGMFTLILGAIFPAKTIDRFSVLKFIFVIMTMGGIVLISVGGTEELYVDASTGTILSLSKSPSSWFQFPVYRKRDNQINYFKKFYQKNLT